MTDPDAAQILKRMLRSGSWAPDLKIVTPTRTFDVHKSVICQASPFFQAACKNGWQEAKSGVIEIPENALVVEEILSYCYGTRDDGLHACTEQCNSHSPNSPCRTLDFDTLIAAQKYQIGPLIKDIRDALLDFRDHEEVAKYYIALGIWAYAEERRFALPPVIVRLVVQSIAEKMRFILRDANNYSALSACPELLKDVVRLLSKHSDIVEADPSCIDPDYLELQY